MSPFELDFTASQRLMALVLLPLVWLALIASSQRRARRIDALLGDRSARLVPAAGSSPMPRILIAAAVASCALAIAEPRSGAPVAALEHTPTEIVLCLDVSRSMLARDVAPSRFERARREIEELVRGASGERFALVVFAGEARVVSPFTSDGEALLELLAATGPHETLRGGTDLAAALARASELIERSKGTRAGGEVAGRAVVLLTDGEDHGGAALDAARALAERDVAVLALGLGTERGSKIAVEQEGGARFLVDSSGADVVSAVDVRGLEELAMVGGGAFAQIVGSGNGGALAHLHRSVVRARVERRLLEEDIHERPHRFQWFVGAALGLFALAALSNGGRS